MDSDQSYGEIDHVIVSIPAERMLYSVHLTRLHISSIIQLPRLAHLLIPWMFVVDNIL